VLGARLVFLGGGNLWAAALGSTGPPTSLCRTGGCGPLFDNTKLSNLGGRVVFLQGSPDAGYGLWASDGTTGGTLRLEEVCPPGSCSFSQPHATQAGNALFFTVPNADESFNQLWRSDGTRAGTRRFATQALSNNTEDPPTVAVLKDKVFFAAIDDNLAPSSPYELWVSDGTAAGASQLTDTTYPLGSSPSNLIAIGDRMFFAIADSSLWSSAGTAASTLPLSSYLALETTAVAAFGGVVFMSAAGGLPQLWWSDGTAAGTRQLTSPPLAPSTTIPPVAAGGKLYFLAAGSTTGGASIWRSDGTPAGTAELLELPPAISQVGGLAVAGSDLYILANGVWKSDGTPGGTVQLTPFGAPVPFGSAPTFLALDGLVYFVAADEQNNATTHLYRTDGTPAGTAVVQVGGISFGDVTNLQVAGGALYFFGADGPGNANRDLWRTDGTAAGTQVLGKFSNSLGINGQRLEGGLISFGNGFAFYADDGVHGSEVWVTDGTAAGTRLVSDIVPGPLGSNPSGLAAAGGRLYLAADDGIHGRELWESDGTAAGTRMVQDINPGPAPSNPSGMTAAGGLLFFSADDGLTGQEPWALPLGGPGGCVPSATALCVAGGRFKVEAFWRDFQHNSGAGQAQPLTGDTGTFWFFSPDNVEVIVKVLDGRALDGHFWVFYGALSNVEYSLTVTDTATGLTRRYLNPLGELASVGDTTAFGPMGATAIGGPPAGAAAVPARQVARAEGIRVTPFGRAAAAAPEAAGGGCHGGPLQLCLNGGRFAVTATWTDFNGNSGVGTAVALTGETGYFWFFAAGNVETVLKVIDGRGLNGHFWVFYGALSNVRYTLTVTDTVTGAVKTYTNAAGQFASVADTSAF